MTELRIAGAAWSSELAGLLEAAMRRDPYCTIGTLERAVREDRATLLRISDEAGALAGAIALELDRHERGIDGAIVAAAFTRRMTWRHVPAILAELERRFRGAMRVRVETPSRGLVRLLARCGYRVRLVTLFKDLAPAPAQLRASSPAREAELELEAREATPARARRQRAELEAVPGLCFIKGHQSNRTATEQHDRRLALAEGAIGISGDENVLNVLDANAIEKAFDFASASDQETHKTLAGVLDFAGVVYETGAKQVERAYEGARGEATQKNLVAAAALATVAVVAVRAWGKK